MIRPYKIGMNLGVPPISESIPLYIHCINHLDRSSLWMDFSTLCIVHYPEQFSKLNNTCRPRWGPFPTRCGPIGWSSMSDKVPHLLEAEQLMEESHLLSLSLKVETSFKSVKTVLSSSLNSFWYYAIGSQPQVKPIPDLFGEFSRSTCNKCFQVGIFTLQKKAIL